jgi:hypothetical protein
MKEVWIFGDSYAQPDPIVFESTNDLVNLDFTTWPLLLKQKYNVKNFAKGGTGPSWSLNKLIQQIKNTDKNDLKNVNVIFLVSAIWRIDLSFYNSESHQCLTAQIPAPSREMISFGWNILNLSKEEKRAIKPYASQKNFVKDLWKYYLLNDTYQQTELTKIIGAVNLYNTLFEKVLLWPIFHKPAIEIDYSNNNFYYINDLLYEVEKDPYGFGYDPRQNHLSKENHTIMFNQLSNWIENSQSIDINKFVKL